MLLSSSAKRLSVAILVAPQAVLEVIFLLQQLPIDSKIKTYL